MFFKHLIAVLVIFHLCLVVLGAGDRDRDRDKGRDDNRKSSNSSITGHSYLAAIYDGTLHIGTGIFTKNYDVLCLHNILPERVLHLTIRFGSFGQSDFCDIKEIAGVTFKGRKFVLLRPKNKGNLNHLMFIDLPTKRNIRQIERGPFTTFQMVSS